jgi:hypothetical protein
MWMITRLAQEHIGKVEQYHQCPYRMLLFLKAQEISNTELALGTLIALTENFIVGE